MEPKQSIQGSAADRSQNSPGEKLPLMAAFASAMFMIVFFAFYPILLNMSAIVDQEGLGTAAVTGIISSLFTIGNAIAGVIFAGVYKAAGRFTIPVGLVLWAAGTAIFSFGHNLPMIVIGVVVCGIAVQIVWPGTINSFAGYVPPSKQSMASALFVSGMNLGCFLTSFYITGVADLTGNADPRLPLSDRTCHCHYICSHLVHSRAGPQQKDSVHKKRQIKQTGGFHYEDQ